MFFPVFLFCAKTQSNYRSFTKFYDRHTAAKSLVGSVLQYLAGAGYRGHKYVRATQYNF